jgi:hypothetical protein
VDGASTVEIIRRFQLAATMPGRYPLGPIAVTMGKETFRSEPLTLVATAASTRVGSSTPPAEGAHHPSGPGNAASLLMDLMPARPWAGQPCILRVRLVLRASLAEDPQYTPPVTPGFWSDKSGPPTSYFADERGERVLVTETRTRLYPLAAGSSTVGAAEASLALAGGEPGGSWQNDHSPRHDVVVRSEPVDVSVAPLPGGAPDGFTGAVGGLSARWSADRARTSADVPITLRLDLRGIANLPLIRPPEVASPDVDVFASSIEDSLAPAGNEGPGRKRFSWTVLPRHTGTVTIDPPHFAWFDPASGAYHRLDAAPVAVEVGPGLYSNSGEGAGLPRVFSRHPVDPGERDALPWAWSLAGLAVGVAIVLWRSGEPSADLRKLRARPLEWLRAVGKTSGPDFWRAAEESSQWLADRGRTMDQLRERIATARYGGVPADAEAIRRQLVDRLSRALPEVPARGARRLAAIVLVAGAAALCFFTGPQPGESSRAAAVRAADVTARAGDPQRARTQWLAAWQAGARHPGLAARLAWAEAQSGSVGASSAWVVRGERLGGRDPALEWIAARVREGGGLIGNPGGGWPVRPIEWAAAALVFGALAGLAWPRRIAVGLAVALCVLAGVAAPAQRMIVERTRCGVIRETVTLEGADLDLQPGQVVEPLEKKGDRVRVSAGGGAVGWVPETAVDVVRGAS